MISGYSGLLWLDALIKIVTHSFPGSHSLFRELHSELRDVSLSRTRVISCLALPVRGGGTGLPMFSTFESATWGTKRHINILAYDDGRLVSYADRRILPVSFVKRMETPVIFIHPCFCAR